MNISHDLSEADSEAEAGCMEREGETTALRILILGDRSIPVELVLSELRRAGFEPDWRQVVTEAQYSEHLGEDPDVILADYVLPQYDSLGALHLLHQRGLDIPFIIIGERIGEQVAVECLKEGAADYLLKDRLGRLGLAVRRALREKGQREESRQAVAVLRENEARLRGLAENTPDIIYRYRLTTPRGVEFINSAVLTITGYGPAEFYDDPGLFLELIHPEDSEAIRRRITTPSAIPNPLAARIVHKDGSVIWLDHRYVPFYDEARNLVAVEGIIRDVTEDRRKPDGHNWMKELRDDLAESVGDGVIVRDAEGNLTFVSRGAAALLGYSPEELLARHWTAIVVSDRQGTGTNAGERSTGGDTDRYELELCRKDGSRVPVLASDSHRFENSVCVGTMTVFIDITDRRRAEEALEFERDAFHAVAEAAVCATDTADLCRRVLAGFVHVLEFDVGTLLALEEERGLLRPIVVIGTREKEEGDELRARSMNDPEDPAVFVASTGQALLIEDVKRREASDPQTARLLNLGVRSNVTWPVFDADHGLLGVMELSAYAPKEFAEEDRRFFDTLATMLGAALERLMSEEVSR